MLAKLRKWMRASDRRSKIAASLRTKLTNCRSEYERYERTDVSYSWAYEEAQAGLGRIDDFTDEVNNIRFCQHTSGGKILIQLKMKEDLYSDGALSYNARTNEFDTSPISKPDVKQIIANRPLYDNQKTGDIIQEFFYSTDEAKKYIKSILRPYNKRRKELNAAIDKGHKEYEKESLKAVIKLEQKRAEISIKGLKYMKRLESVDEEAFIKWKVQHEVFESLAIEHKKEA